MVHNDTVVSDFFLHVFSFETTPNEDLDSKSHENVDISDLQQQPEGQLYPGEMVEKPAEHGGSNHGDQKEGDPSQEMMEGTNPMDQTTQYVHPDSHTDSGENRKAGQKQAKIDTNKEEPMEAEPDPNRDSKHELKDR